MRIQPGTHSMEHGGKSFVVRRLSYLQVVSFGGRGGGPCFSL